MSAQGVDAAIEQICSDGEVMSGVVRDGATALESFDLTDEERTGIAEAVRTDVDDATGDDGGGDGGFRSKFAMPSLTQFASVNGGIARSPRDVLAAPR